MTHKVLIVEDNPLVAKVWGAKLRSLGYEVHTALDGRSARLAVRDNPPDVVLLDVLLPETDGLTLCREWKSDPRTRDMRIIVVSAFNSGRDVEAALEAGADDYIPKSPHTAALLATKLGAHPVGVPKAPVMEPVG